MTPEQFVHAIREQVERSAVETTEANLRKPPGRHPVPELLALSQWFRNLPENDRRMVLEAVSCSAKAAVFGFFCVLDGVRVVEDGEDKGEFELLFRKGEVATRLNDPEGELLHDLYNTA